jgi:hypothetical protein
MRRATTPRRRPAPAYVRSFAPMTRSRTGTARNVCVIVSCRYSPVTPITPKSNAKMLAHVAASSTSTKPSTSASTLSGALATCPAIETPTTTTIPSTYQTIVRVVPIFSHSERRSALTSSTPARVR